jgi:putative oxidoreductase
MRAIWTISPAIETGLYAIAALLARIVAAHVFFSSGQTKVSGPTVGGMFHGVDLSFKLPTALSDSAVALFEDEYKLPHIPPEIAAYAAAAAEHILPALLLLGLLTRLSALGLLVMTLIIQFLVYPDAWWSAHAYWAALLLVLIARGGGALSLDALLFRRG